MCGKALDDLLETSLIYCELMHVRGWLSTHGWYVNAVVGDIDATELLIQYSGFLLWVIGLYTIYLQGGHHCCHISLPFDEGVEFPWISIAVYNILVVVVIGIPAFISGILLQPFLSYW